MRILAVFLDTEKRKALITITPSWLGRLFGARARQGTASRYVAGSRENEWTRETTGRSVDTDFTGRPVTRALETAEVVELPAARLQTKAAR